MEQGEKFDTEKCRYDLLPMYAIEALGDVLTYGAGKYGVRNWEKGILYGRLFAATLRHLFAWWRREEYDAESGLSHLAHALTNIAFLIELEHTHLEMDDRPLPKISKKGE